jgi:hypothetical protein
MPEPSSPLSRVACKGSNNALNLKKIYGKLIFGFYRYSKPVQAETDAGEGFWS